MYNLSDEICATCQRLFLLPVRTPQRWTYLPPISVAIGEDSVQYSISCISFTALCAPRLVSVVVYYQRNVQLIAVHEKPFLLNLPKVASIVNVLENVAVLGIVYFDYINFYGKLAHSSNWFKSSESFPRTKVYESVIAYPFWK